MCKKPKDSFGTFSANNLTITDAEGRLVSPGKLFTCYYFKLHIRIPYDFHVKKQIKNVKRFGTAPILTGKPLWSAH